MHEVKFQKVGPFFWAYQFFCKKRKATPLYGVKMPTHLLTGQSVQWKTESLDPHSRSILAVYLVLDRALNHSEPRFTHLENGRIAFNCRWPRLLGGNTYSARPEGGMLLISLYILFDSFMVKSFENGRKWEKALAGDDLFGCFPLDAFSSLLKSSRMLLYISSALTPT